MQKNDARKVRRIIAENPEWNLMVVPPLYEMCLISIVSNFVKLPTNVLSQVSALNPRYRSKVLDKLPTDLPLSVSAPVIEDESYWKRCCKNRWSVCDISEHGGLWKRMYMERSLKEYVESFDPMSSIDEEEQISPEEQKLDEILALSADYVYNISINQLMPGNYNYIEHYIQDKDDQETLEDIIDGKPITVHYRFMNFFKKLNKLEKFRVTYGVKDVGMNFEWSMFQFSEDDCKALSKALKSSTSLRNFQLISSTVDCKKLKIICLELIGHATLNILDFSHNKIADNGAKYISKMLSLPDCRLTEINLTNNRIGPSGASFLSKGLAKNQSLKELNLRLNKIGDDGAEALFKSLKHNKTLITLNVSSNSFGEASCKFVTELILTNKTLEVLDLSCNKLDESGGKLLQESVEENSTLQELNLALTSVSQESEACICMAIEKNNKLKKQRIIK